MPGGRRFLRPVGRTDPVTRDGRPGTIAGHTPSAKDDEHKRLLEHDIELSKGTGIVSALQRLVRPLITYAFFGLFTVVEISMLIHLLSSGIDLEAALQHVWDDETQAIFATVITFWFGTRVFEKKAPRVS